MKRTNKRALLLGAAVLTAAGTAGFTYVSASGSSEQSTEAAKSAHSPAGGWDLRFFAVAGRIIYEYENGGWNEWHIVFQDGTSGWLSDAQLEYAISSPFKDAGKLPTAEQDFPVQTKTCRLMGALSIGASFSSSSRSVMNFGLGIKS